MKSYIGQIFAGTLGASIGFYFVAVMCERLLSNFQTGDKDFVLLGLYFGLPFGTSSGLLILEKIIHTGNLSVRRMLFGWVISILVITSTIFLMDVLGPKVAIILPLMIASIFVICLSARKKAV